MGYREQVRVPLQDATLEQLILGMPKGWELIHQDVWGADWAVMTKDFKALGWDVWKPETALRMAYEKIGASDVVYTKEASK